MPEKLPKSVLITGANRGIGYGLVKEFLKHSEVEFVFAGVRKPESAKELLEIHDSRLKIVKLDVTSDESIKAVEHQVASMVGDHGLNLLINNAAVLIPYWLNEEPNRANLLEMHNVNLVSPIVVAHFFLPLLRKAARSGTWGISTSAVINISSELGSNTRCQEPGSGRLGFIPYKSSKAAMNRFTATLSEDIKNDGILVAAFHPGWVQTDMGGPEAPTPLAESVGNLVKSFGRLGEEHCGGFFDNEGNVIEY
ncbi:unnamed protein product, partial [Mesorhabditis spiculigera]